jgi:hypothetical protein
MKNYFFGNETIKTNYGHRPCIFGESIWPFQFLDIYFCPFLKIPKYFAQKNMKNVKKTINWKKDLKKIYIIFPKGLKELI